MKLSAIQRFTMLDFPDRVACIAFTPGCNMRCGFCHNPEFVLPEKLRKLSGNFINEETFFNFLERRRDRLEGVVVSGGEPTIWQDLPEFLRQIKERGFLTKLDTNGYQPNVLEQLLNDKLVDYVALDVKTSLREYTSLVGVGIDAKNIEKSINLLKGSLIPYEFRTTLIKEIHTEEVFKEMEPLVADARQYFLQIFRPAHTLHPSFTQYHPFSREEMDTLAGRFGRLVGRIGVRAESH